MQKGISFSEKNINIGDKSYFTVLGKFTFLNFKSESILVRSLLHPLSSLRFEDLRSIFHRWQFIKQLTYLFPTVLSPPPSSPLACLTGSHHLPQEGLGAQYLCFCSH